MYESGQRAIVRSRTPTQGVAAFLKVDRSVAIPGTDKLRQLAAWYREFADRAGNPWVWEARLRTAEDLEAEADRVEAELALVRDQKATD